MRTHRSTRFREHPWLATAVTTYLLLSAIEMTRNLVLAHPLDGQDVGFSTWKEMPAEDAAAGTLLFRSAEPQSTLVRPVQGAVLSLLLIDSSAEAPKPVTFTLDGEVLDAYSLPGVGTYSFRYYLPPVLGAETWSKVEGILAQRTRARADSARGGWPSRWQELRPWRLSPDPPFIRIETSLGTAPPDAASAAASAAGEGASGVGIASVEWLDDLPADGFGFHPSEVDAAGVAFRWTRRWASLPLAAGGREAVVRVRAIHPDIDQQPVIVDLFWGARMLRSVSLSTTEWSDIAIALPAEAPRDGVLSLRTDRTWSPARVGVSRDSRELGVALAAVSWR